MPERKDVDDKMYAKLNFLRNQIRYSAKVDKIDENHESEDVVRTICFIFDVYYDYKDTLCAVGRFG
jgi:hypothetical protein